jgi:hypothetical protein
LALVAGVIGCGGSSNNQTCTTVTGTASAQYVADSLTLPASSMQFAYDANGDGKKKNQLGNLVAGLSTMLDPQKATTDSITMGNLIMLMQTKGSDATFTTDSCASATVSSGKSMMNPDYSGNGTFMLAMTGGEFKGSITASKFTSSPPASMATMPVSLTLPLPLIPGGEAIKLIATGAELSFTHTADGKIMSGQINGVIKKSDVDTVIIPSVAKTLNMRVQADPTGSKPILDLFDDGGVPDPACSATTMGCKNLDGSCAKAKDGIIGDCELSTNSLIMNFLRADVAMFDAAGNYHPDPTDMNKKDSLTLGLGFTAVKAKF